jgi:hypothetical protein
MRKGFCLLLLSGVVLLAMPGASGGMTGNDFQRLVEPARMAYVLGMIDGWENVVGMIQYLGERVKAGSLERIYGDILRCLGERKIPVGQAHAIVDKYVKDNPGMWHEEMSHIVWKALFHACK